MKLSVIRHGETEWNKAGKIQGRIDIPLSLYGIQQAHTASKYLAEREFDVAYTSPLRRAYQTAEIICARHKIDLRKSEKLQEIDFGTWQGLVWSDIVRKNSDLIDEFERLGNLASIYGGESYQDLQDRAEDFLDYISGFSYDSVLVVSHAGLIKAMICSITGLDISKRNRFNINNLSISTLNYEKERGWAVNTLNDYSYLDDLFSLNGQI